MELEMLSVPRVRVAELQSLAEHALMICSRHGQLQAATEKVHTELNEYRAGMQRKPASAAVKADLDKVRDRLITGLFFRIRAEENFPHESPEAKVHLANLSALKKKYHASITSLPLDEETAAVDNLLAELKTMNIAQFANGRVQMWWPLIMDANNKFKTAAQGYVADSAEAAGKSSASAKAPQLIAAMNAMFTMMYAFTQVSGDAALLKSYSELQVLLNAAK